MSGVRVPLRPFVIWKGAIPWPSPDQSGLVRVLSVNVLESPTVKAPSRSALLVAGLAAALAAAADPSVAGAQRNRAPGPDTKKVLVTALRGDAEAGIRVADEIRNRVSDEFNIKE